MRDVKPHWLAPATKTRTPRVVVTFDTETYETEGGDHSVQRLRCWDAKVRRRGAAEGSGRNVRYYAGESPATLYDVVETASQIDDEVWVIAHNVGFDLAVTSLPFVMVEHEWTLDGVHLGDESSWWVLKKAQRKVIITDSWSWLRCSLADAAKDIGRRKVRLPDADDSLDAWHKRCRKDVDILDELMVTIMDWWDQNQLGVFGLTGAACGWRSLRRVIGPKKILVGPDGARTAFEREAVFGGMKDVYGVGEFHDTWISDDDFVGAYPTAAAAFPSPAMPIKKWTTTAALLDADPPPQRDYIARVEISTHVPCAPCRIGDEIFRPVGTFRTTLTGPEVRYAMSRADRVTVISWRAYKMTYALANWAAWCLKLQNDTTGTVPDVVARVAKNWGRLAIGRFATRTSQVIATRPATHLGWHLETGHDLDTGRRVEWLSMGGVEQTIVKDLDGADCFPAVLAFIEGHVRVALSQLLDSRQPNLLLQCNTDGWWEMKADRRSDYRPEFVPWPFRTTRKALERRLLVKGPNHVMSPHERRYAGVPAESVVSSVGTMAWRDWPSLRWQLEHSATGEYKRPDREAILSEHYVRRWVLDTGETIPVTATTTVDGEVSILPWCRSWGQRDGDVLAPYQIPILAKVNESDRELGDIEPDALPIQPGRDFPSTPRGGRVHEPYDPESTIDPAWSFATKQIALG